MKHWWLKFMSGIHAGSAGHLASVLTSRNEGALWFFVLLVAVVLAVRFAVRRRTPSRRRRARS